MPPKAKPITAATNLKKLFAAELATAPSAIQDKCWQLFQTRLAEEILVETATIGKAALGKTTTSLLIIQRYAPFQLDSLLGAFRHHNLAINNLHNALIKTKRDDAGQLLDVRADSDQSPHLLNENVIYLEVSGMPDQASPAALKAHALAILGDVWACVRDWRSMQAQLADTIDDLQTLKTQKLDTETIDEAAQFLTFLTSDHFTFLGYREYTVRIEGKKTYFDPVKKLTLGVLRDKNALLFDGLLFDQTVPTEVREFFTGNQKPLILLKASRLSQVHRPVPLDVVGVKLFDKQGRITAIRLFAGLYTSECYTRSVTQIPHLRRKARSVIQRANFDANSHNARALAHIIESYPRDELMQIDNDTLYQHILGMHQLQNRPDVGVFMRTDRLYRFFSVLVFVPRDRYDTRLRQHIQAILETNLQGQCLNYQITANEQSLARLQFTISIANHQPVAFNVDKLTQQVRALCQPWSAELEQQAHQFFGEKLATTYLAGLTQSYPVGYQDEVPFDLALHDLPLIQNVRQGATMAVNVRHYVPHNTSYVTLCVPNSAPALAKIMPILGHLGFAVQKEFPYTLKTDATDIVLLRLSGEFPNLTVAALEKSAAQIAATFTAVYLEQVADDNFNALVPYAGLDAWQADIFRGLGRFLQLAGYAQQPRNIAQILAKHAGITQQLAQLFDVKFNPATPEKQRNVKANNLVAQVQAACQNITSVDEDRVLNSYVNLIQNILRTNFYNDAREALAFKFNSKDLADLPLPRPLKEIFMFAPRFEAVHLRTGDVARGGIRWSDRYDDFRTEILGLMKAQNVKNTVIIPVGAKGGFIAKNLWQIADAAAKYNEAVACYQSFVRTLLSLTDNVVKGKIVPPANIACHDAPDPYLVVAADKGTAKFSDIANAISVEHNFWLGDAFASGGSKGYDHKEMGITAKGGWECVKRHFRELGKDIQTTPFTCVGVGDMSGDVFGNGMLLSEQTQLLAAFDHRHIFVDPNPDIKASFAERTRMFHLPTSSWDNYDRKKISKGGMIISRQEKMVTLTPEVQARFDIAEKTISPNDLMKRLLQAPVELLWFGGIGTFIKAAGQGHDQASDKANDSVRVDAEQVQALVIGEGANMGMTQSARIAYANKGGKLNSDFIDNSAGVDTSDHEVNIKILLQPLLLNKTITEAERVKLLRQMTNDIGLSVLQDNYEQSLALSIATNLAPTKLAQHTHLMRSLETDKLLDRKVEGLPNGQMLQELQQQRRGLSRPELAVILSYSKMQVYSQILGSDLPDDAAFATELQAYFPKILQKKFAKPITQHKLRREIVATRLTNQIVNIMGPSFVSTVMQRTTQPISRIIKAWCLVRDGLGLGAFWHNLGALDNGQDSATQLSAYIAVREMMSAATYWILAHEKNQFDLTKQTIAYQKASAELLAGWLATNKKPAALEDWAQNLPNNLQNQWQKLQHTLIICQMISLQQEGAGAAKNLATHFAELYQILDYALILPFVRLLPAENVWAETARASLHHGLLQALNQLTLQRLQSKDSVTDAATWLAANKADWAMITQILRDIRYQQKADFALLSLLQQKLMS